MAEGNKSRPSIRIERAQAHLQVTGVSFSAGTANLHVAVVAVVLAHFVVVWMMQLAKLFAMIEESPVIGFESRFDSAGPSMVMSRFGWCGLRISLLPSSSCPQIHAVLCMLPARRRGMMHTSLLLHETCRPGSQRGRVTSVGASSGTWTQYIEAIQRAHLYRGLSIKLHLQRHWLPLLRRSFERPSSADTLELTSRRLGVELPVLDDLVVPGLAPESNSDRATSPRDRAAEQSLAHCVSANMTGVEIAPIRLRSGSRLLKDHGRMESR